MRSLSNTIAVHSVVMECVVCAYACTCTCMCMSVYLSCTCVHV